MEILSGIIHGNTIELTSHPSLADGERVIVTIQPSTQGAAESKQSAAGMLAEHWTEEDDQILAEIEQERRLSKFREVEE